MPSRILVLVLALYVTLDFGTPLSAGAFEFDPDDSVDAVSVVRDSADAGILPLIKVTAGRRQEDLLDHVRLLRPAARPAARPVLVRRVCPSPPCQGHLPPGDDH